MATADYRAAVAKFERAKRTNTKCNAKELAIRDELRQIERRKVELATMRKMNRGQRNVWLQELTETTIIPYTESWNLSFAEQIQAFLPPEIRTMVYDYLMDDTTWAKYEHHFLAVTSVLDPDIGHCRCMKQVHGLPRLPHFLYPQYVGRETALELVQTVYSKDWFKDKTLYGSTSHLQSLVHEDPFGTGFDPAPYVRSIDIVCFVDRYRTIHACPRREICQPTTHSRRYIDQENIKSDFEKLLGLEKNKGFRSLTVSFVQRNVRLDVLEEALEAFSDVYQAFRAAGSALRVEWKYTSPTCGNLWHVHNRNLVKFFTEPRLTWKHRMLQYLKRMQPCMETRHVRFNNEPSLGLSDMEFVHHMWDDDETYDITDDEDSDEDLEEAEESEVDGDADLDYITD